MGKIIVPYSGVKNTGADCPSIKLFLPFSEGAGNMTTCPRTGNVWDITNNSEDDTGTLIWNPDGSVTSSLDYSIPPSALSAAIGTIRADKVYLAMAVGRVNGELCRASLGDINQFVPGSGNTGLGMSDGLLNGTGRYHAVAGLGDLDAPVRWIVDVASDTELCTTAQGEHVVTFLKYSPNVSLDYQSHNYSTGTTILEADTVDFSDDATPFVLSPYFRFSGYDLYGFVLFEFTEFPGWINTAIYWMAEQWANAGLGKQRYIYPKLSTYTG